MRVLYVYDGKLKGHGLDLVARQQLQALSDSGAETVLVSRGRSNHKAVVTRKIVLNPAKLLSWRPAKEYYGANRRYIDWTASKLLRKQAFDAVVAWSHCAESLVEAAKEKDVPVLVNSASVSAFGWEQAGVKTRWPMISPERVRAEFEGARFVLAPSEAAARRYVEDGLQKDRVIPLDRGFDPKQFYPPEQKPDKFRAIFCGRVCDRKGAKQVVTAWREANLKDAELWFLGEVDREIDDWAAEVKANSPDVKFLGFREDVPDLMRQASVQILLSRNESFGKALVEGAASGLVTIGTADIGFPIIDGVNGYTVEREDAKGAADLLHRLAGDADELSSLSERARKHVNENFTWKRFHERFIGALRSATEGAPSK